MALPSIQLGPYQLHERIGEGGNGQVYRATGPRGTVAIKLIGGDLDAAAVARFRREIVALGELAHPSLIPLLDHGVDPELGPYLVLPLLAGKTLRELCRGRALCPEAALLLALPIAEATAALHARGYVHRDLKPENAIATPDGAVTVIDLGLAWGDGMSRHTESGAAVGSIGYMPPEQLDGRPAGASADVWAIGVMLYEWIAGKRPFARARPTEEVAATLLGAYARLTAADRRAGEELADLVGRCLATEPRARPSIAELVDALAAAIDWAPAAQRVAERAAVVADPEGYQARIAAFRVRRLERLGREALDAGKPFVALAHCDRGLAYVPEHPALLGLVAEAEAATARATDARPPRATASEPPAAADRGALALAKTEAIATDRDALALAKTEAITTDRGALALAKTEAVATDRGARTPTAHAPAARPGRRTLALAIGGTAVAVAAVFVIAARTDAPTDPWAAKTTATAPAAPAPSSVIDERDRALVRDFVAVFDKAMDSSRGDPPPHAGPAPTTATGWLALARTQAPADALASIRHALRLSPAWAEAQDALCVALVATGEPGAVDACTTSVRRRPHDVGLRAARARALIAAERPTEALADLDVVIAADPAPAWRRMRAAARSAVGDDAGAKRDLEHACTLGDAVACQMK